MRSATQCRRIIVNGYSSLHSYSAKTSFPQTRETTFLGVPPRNRRREHQLSLSPPHHCALSLQRGFLRILTTRRAKPFPYIHRVKCTPCHLVSEWMRVLCYHCRNDHPQSSRERRSK